MKKILVAGLTAIALIAVAGQPASAWHNGKFSIGLNIEHQSGNNSCFWGMFHNGQLPGPEAYGQVYGYESRSHFHTDPQYYHGPAHTFHTHAQVYEVPAYQYAQPVYAAPYQFAAYPQPVYYYPTSYYYYGQ